MALADQSITSAKLNLDLSSAQVATSETTTSTSYTDLATSGPAVTVTTGVAQDHLILFGSVLDNSGASWSYTNVAVAGGAVDDTQDTMDHNGTDAEDNGSSHIHATAQASGATHTQKYQVNANTGIFEVRRITGVGI